LAGKRSPVKKRILLLLLLLAPACARRVRPEQPAGPRILGVAHMALFVTDLQRSRAFYRDLLGFEEAFTLPKPDGSDRIAFIKINDQQYLELFADPPRTDGRVYHISFYTDDAEGLRRALEARGVKVPPTVGTGKIGNTQFGVTDPDGHGVELVQYHPAGWTLRGKGKSLPESRISSHIAHLGVLVGELGPSLLFYQKLLGFQETWRGGPSPKQLSWVNLRVPHGDDYLELMLYDQLPPPEERGGKNHVCLMVPNVVQAVALLESRPARKLYLRPIEVKVGVNRKRQANLFDPDGTRIELMEPTTIDGQPTPSSTAPPPRP
jgi:catechol 2,3-dioxygenase-like lactoylglutathione lyase family enzyme